MNRYLRVALVLVLVAGLLTACAPKEAATEARTASTSRLQRILKSGKIKIAMIPDNPGYSVQSSTGEWVGFDVDIGRMLAASLKAELEIIPSDGASRLTMVTADKADIVVSNWVPMNERAHSIAFSIPYCASGLMGLCRADRVLNSWEEVTGVTVSYARGSSAEKFIMETYPETKAVTFDNIADSYMALKSGKVDVLLESIAQINELAKEDPSFVPMNVEMARPVYNAMGFALGDPDWRGYIDNFVRINLYNGVFKGIWDKHFEIPFAELYNY